MVAPIEFTRRLRGSAPAAGSAPVGKGPAARAEAQIEAATERVRARIRPATLADPRPGAELRAHVRASAENRPGIYRMLGPGDEMV
jgi:hypothetical protein